MISLELLNINGTSKIEIRYNILYGIDTLKKRGKMYFIKYLLLIFFITSLSFGAKLDKKIIDANRTYYNQLLNRLSETNNSDPLEKILLEQIINFRPAPFQEKSITQAKESESLKKLFDLFIDTIKEISQYQKKLQEKKKKIETIEDEIKKLEDNSSKILSFELQDAFYHKQLLYYQEMIQHLQIQLLKIQKSIQSSLQNISINRKKTEDSIKRDLKKIEQLRDTLTKIEISLEQVELIKNSIATKYLKENLKKRREKLFRLSYRVFQNRFLLFLSYLKEKNQKTFALEKQLYKDAIKYKIISKKLIDSYFSPFLLSLEKQYIGNIRTLAGSSKQEIKEVAHQSWELLNRPIFDINGTPVSIFNMTLAFIIFILGIIVGIFYKYKIKNLNAQESTLSSSTKTLLANLGYYLIVIISFFIALNILGVKLSSLAIVAGALSVGIGFGLQNVVSNFVSGIILMFERSIKIGDYIEVGDNRGYVTDIRMRSTTIKTNENIDIVIPNQQFIENKVINWTMNDKIRRFSIPFGVAYGSDVDQVIKVVKKAVMESDYRPYIIDRGARKTQVIMTAMADSSVNFELLVWLKGNELIDRPKRTRSYFLVIIYKTLYKYGIEIPFPQRDLHIRSISDEVTLSQVIK